MAVGPTRPPHPRLYADWPGGIRTERIVSFEQQVDTMTALIERWHGADSGRIGVATLMPIYREPPTTRLPSQ